jgi:hypothetical protein
MAVTRRGGCGLLGWDLSGQSRKCGQAPPRTDPEGQPLAPLHPRGMRSRRRSQAQQLPRRAIWPPRQAAWGQEGHRGGRPFDPGRRLLVRMGTCRILADVYKRIMSGHKRFLHKRTTPGLRAAGLIQDILLTQYSVTPIIRPWRGMSNSPTNSVRGGTASLPKNRNRWTLVSAS